MAFEIHKAKAELVGFSDTLKENLYETVQNFTVRIKDPKEWGHIYVDLGVSFVSVLKAAVMPYTYGHILAVLVPILLFL
jgi:hypothetical protein